MSSNPGNQRELGSFLVPRDPSIDRRFRPRPTTRERLFPDINEYENNESSEDEYEEPTSTGSCEYSEPSLNGKSGALVYLRLKPVHTASSIYTISEEGDVLITAATTDASGSKCSVQKHYSFSAIFDAARKQHEVYDECVGPKIQAGEGFTIMTYGTSGSGKTYTLLGDCEHPGVIPRAMENLFSYYKLNISQNPILKILNGRVSLLDDDLVIKEKMLRQRIFGSCPNLNRDFLNSKERIAAEHEFSRLPVDQELTVLIWVSFVEIYNELVYDLLAFDPTANSKNNARTNLKVVCNDGKVFIKGLTTVLVKDSEEALKLLRLGMQNLTYASTSVNAHSSRSHCIFFVDVLKYRSAVINQISYKFCDLAGSERVNKTGNTGTRLNEAKHINKSLMVLGRCLDTASKGTTNRTERIPYRESKLTLLLQASLLGNEKLAMIVTLTPTEKYYEENVNVLGFAAIARNIVFKAPVTEKKQSRFSMLGANPGNQYMEELLDENAWLRCELERLSQLHATELVKLEHDLRNSLVDSFQKTLDENKRQFEHRLQCELANQKRTYESRIEFLKRNYEEEIQELLDDIENLEKKRGPPSEKNCEV